MGNRRGVALGGFMATGKTTVGHRVARRLGLPFVDLDARIEQDAGKTVSQLFADEGEAGFRGREARALDRVLGAGPAVVALGGGTLHHGDNLQRLARTFDIVVLDAELDVVEQRLAAQGGRPLAAAARELWTQRRAGYLAAGTVVDTRDLDPDQVADRVIEVLA